jgi:hypothetical protein
MKKLVSAIAVAAGLAMASGAHASWEVGDGIASPWIGNGEALLTVFDSVAQKSYALDLGVRYDDLVSGAAFNGQTIAVDLSVFGGNTSNLQWHVAVASGHYVNQDFTEEQFDKYGFGITTNASQTRSVAGLTPEQQSTLISNVMTEFQIGAASVLQMNIGAPSANTAVAEGTANGPKYVGGALWGTYFDSKLSGDSLGVLGETQAFWAYGFAGAASDSNPTVRNLGSLTLTSTGLTFNSAAPAVPVPAAAWLLGSALLGLAGVGRSRRKA